MLKYQRAFFLLLAGFIAYLSIDLFVSLPFAQPVSFLTIIGGVVLILIAFIQTQKEKPEIINNPAIGLLLYWMFSFISITIGYSNIYLDLVRQNAHSFVGLSDGMSSIYFSVVTFATVGYGDIYPVSITAKFVVMSQIGIAIITLPIVIAASIGWIINHKQLAEQNSQPNFSGNIKGILRRIK